MIPTQEQPNPSPIENLWLTTRRILGRPNRPDVVPRLTRNDVLAIETRSKN